MKLEMTVWDLKVDLSVKSNNELNQIDLLDKIRSILDELTSFEDVRLVIESVPSEEEEEEEEEEEDTEENITEAEDVSDYRNAA